MEQKDESSNRELAGYIKVAGYVQYWRGVLSEAILCQDKPREIIAAQSLRNVTNNYKKEVPKYLRDLIDIDTGKLEKLAWDVLGKD